MKLLTIEVHSSERVKLEKLIKEVHRKYLALQTAPNKAVIGADSDYQLYQLREFVLVAFNDPKTDILL